MHPVGAAARDRGRDAPGWLCSRWRFRDAPCSPFRRKDRGAAGELRAAAIGPDLLDFEEEGGRPVWNGEEEFTVREAHPEQAVRRYPRLVLLHECVGRKAIGISAPPSRSSKA